jgi:hypothetical protein
VTEQAKTLRTSEMGLFCKPSRKRPFVAPSMKRHPGSMCHRLVCVPLSVAARVIAWCQQARASFYPRSKQWRHAGRRRTGGIGWGGTPSICWCSLRHQARHRVSRPVQIMLAAARAFVRVPRSLCRRAAAGRLVDARIAPQGVENPREPPREGHDRAQLAAPLRQPLHPPPQRGPHRRPTPPVGPRGLDEQPPHADAWHEPMNPTSSTAPPRGS